MKLLAWLIVRLGCLCGLHPIPEEVARAFKARRQELEDQFGTPAYGFVECPACGAQVALEDL